MGCLEVPAHKAGGFLLPASVGGILGAMRAGRKALNDSIHGELLPAKLLFHLGLEPLGGTAISCEAGTGCCWTWLEAVCPSACLLGDTLDTGWQEVGLLFYFFAMYQNQPV